MPELNFNALMPQGPRGFAQGYSEGQEQRNQLMQQQQARQLGDIQLRNALRGEQEALAESEAAKGSSSLKDLAVRQRQAGLAKQALATEAAIAKQRTDQLAQAKTQVELIKGAANQVFANPTNAAQILMQFGQRTGIDVSDDLAEIQKYGGNPDAIKQWASGHVLEADKLLPKFQEFSTPGGGKQLGTVNPMTGAFTATKTMAPQMTPGERAADARAKEQLRVSQGNLQVAQDRLAHDKTKDKNSAAVSEQQASYNIGRVLTAANQIKTIGIKDPSAIQPGGTEALASSIGMGGTANAARNANRQIVYGAQRDALDALLYLATGAAYNKEQLEGQMAAYIPSYTDKDETVLAKQARMTDLIKSAKTRAGKAWTPEMDKAMQSLTAAPAAATPVTPAPKNVPSDLWNAMTPEERKLWK
jgi:hypothetical protein